MSASIDPLLGRPALLFNPRNQKWSDHFRFEGARIRGVTGTGRVTALLLRLNHPERLAERRLLLQAGMLQPPEL